MITDANETVVIILQYLNLFRTFGKMFLLYAGILLVAVLYNNNII